MHGIYTDKDVISYPTNLSILCHIAKLVNEGFYQDGGKFVVFQSQLGALVIFHLFQLKVWSKKISH